jgi:hypothetical protein
MEFFNIIVLLPIFSIFFGFTFTDIEDYTPLLSLIIGIILIILICRRRREKASAGLTISMYLLSLWPVLPNISLFFMARQLQSISGAWPQVMVDDPKNWLGHVTPLYDALFHLTNYLQAFSGAWMILFFALYFGAKSRLNPLHRKIILVLMIFMLVISVMDPGNLGAWWLD